MIDPERPSPALFNIGGVGTVVGRLRHGLPALNSVGDFFELALRRHQLLQDCQIDSVDVILLYAEEGGSATGRLDRRKRAFEARVALPMHSLKAAGPGVWRNFAAAALECLSLAQRECSLSEVALRAVQAETAAWLATPEPADMPDD